jgi:hypothetical protein
MRVHRRFKRWVSASLMMLLLFTQLATAAYACPVELQALHAESEMAAMPGCVGDMWGGMDADQPELCKAHCQQGEQIVGATPVSEWTPCPMLWAVIDWRHAMRAVLSQAGAHAGPPFGAMPPGSPPIYLSLLVLRN